MLSSIGSVALILLFENEPSAFNRGSADLAGAEVLDNTILFPFSQLVLKIELGILVNVYTLLAGSLHLSNPPLWEATIS